MQLSLSNTVGQLTPTLPDASSLPSTLAVIPRFAEALRLQTALRCALSRLKSRSPTPIASGIVVPPATNGAGVLMSTRSTGFELSALVTPNVLSVVSTPASTSMKPTFPFSSALPATVRSSTASSGLSAALSTLT